MSSSECVLFIDDELSILNSVRRALHDRPYRVLTAGGASEALDILERQAIDVVITDYQMPIMDGVRLLGRIRERFPTTSRVILSGYVGDPEILKCLGSGIATSFFAKPWDDDELQEKIDDILQMRRLLNRRNLLKLINTIRTLPTAPSLYLRVVQHIEDDDPMQQIEQTIAKDPTVTTVILHVVNSAFYGGSRSQRITSLRDALMILGLTELRNIVLTVSLLERGMFESEDHVFVQEAFIHSFLVNAYLPSLSDLFLGSPLDRSLQSIGLTANIGMILVLRYFYDRFRAICDYRRANPGATFHAAEKTLGFEDPSHADIGALFLSWWNFPEPLVQSALYHHTPRWAGRNYRDVSRLIGYADDLVLHILSARDAPDLSAYVRDGVSLRELEVMAAGIRRDFEAHSEALYAFR